MYRRPRFLEILLKIREEMAREADYDVDFFTEMVRSGLAPASDIRYTLSEAETGGPTWRTGRPGRRRKTPTEAR